MPPPRPPRPPPKARSKALGAHAPVPTDVQGTDVEFCEWALQVEGSSAPSVTQTAKCTAAHHTLLNTLRNLSATHQTVGHQQSAACV